MASLQFQIHTDKENSSSLPLGPKMIGIVQSAKTFQGPGIQHLKTPRRALGSVNQVDRVAGKSQAPSSDLKPSAKTFLPVSTKPSASTALKPSSITSKAAKSVQQFTGIKDTKTKKSRSQDLEKENKVDRAKHKGEKSAPSQSSAHSVTINYDDLPDIEFIPPPLPPKDDSDDESIWPKKERLSTYFTKVLNWRPPCLFGTQPESEDEETSKHQEIMNELDNISLPCEKDSDFPHVQLHEQDLELDAVPLPSLDDIDLPACEVGSVSSSSNLTAMDDSLGLSTHLGSLVIKDDSFTNHLS